MTLFSKRSVTVEEAHELSGNGSVLVDVRQRHELASGMAKGALHIPVASIDARSAKLEGEHVLVICRSGSRSGRVAAALRRRGIDALNVKGGMLAWSRQGLPMQRRSARR
jgi:rhodanese-related sulfurtransferase